VALSGPLRLTCSEYAPLCVERPGEKIPRRTTARNFGTRGLAHRIAWSRPRVAPLRGRPLGRERRRWGAPGRWAAGALLEALLLTTLPASAELPRPTLHLTLVLPPALVERCPSAEVIRERLGARLGYVPEDGPAATQVEVSIEPSGAKLIGRLRIARAGASARSSALEAPADDCVGLFDALALSLALAIDPLGSGRAAAVPSSTAAAALPAVSTASAAASAAGGAKPPAGANAPLNAIEAPDPPPAERRPLPPRRAPSARGSAIGGANPPAGAPLQASPNKTHFTALAAVVTPFGSLPGGAEPGVGISLAAAWERGGLEIELEGLYVFPQARALAGGSATLSTALARLGLCGQLSALTICTIGSLGAVFASGTGLARPDRGGASAQIGLGPRLALDLDLGPDLGLRFLATGEILPLRAALELDKDAVWTMPLFRGELAIAGWVRLW